MARKTAPRGYHHGNLREALIKASIELVEEGGPDAVSIREAARRAGVSPGAPFRHFPNRTVLMTAIAEQATHRLHEAIFEADDKAKTEPPLDRLRVMGRAYLRWALDHPTHFAIVSNRNLIDYDSSESMKRENGELQALMSQLLEEAGAPAAAKLTARALVYGLARMHIDGHLPQWGGASPRQARSMMDAALDLFVAGLVSQPESSVRPARRPRSGP